MREFLREETVIRFGKTKGIGIKFIPIPFLCVDMNCYTEIQRYRNEKAIPAHICCTVTESQSAHLSVILIKLIIVSP